MAFAVMLAAMVAYWVLLFLTKPRWNQLIMRQGQFAHCERTLSKTLQFVLTAKHRSYADQQLSRLVVFSRAALVLVACGLVLGVVTG